MELFKDTNFDFLGRKWPFITGSLVLIAAGVISLIAKGGPSYGIDFRGGALMYVRFASEPPISRIRAAIGEKIPGDVSVQHVVGENEVMIGTEIADEKQLNQAREIMARTLEATFGDPDSGKLNINNASADVLSNRLRDPLLKANVALSDEELGDLAARITRYRDTPPRSGLITGINNLSAVGGVTPAVLSVLTQETYAAPFAIRSVEIVGPKIGAELRQQALLAVLYALGGMLIYIGFRFEWIYGFAAILAIFHDVLITVGFFSLLDYEISLTVVAALLTLVGYSVNDTIVIFDRVRENLKLMRRESLHNIVNVSVNQTLSRTVLTSGLTLIAALSLLLFGGPVLHGFSFALVIGFVVGSYSTLFIAGPIMVWWHEFMERRKRRPPAGGTPARELPRSGIQRKELKTVK